MIQVLFVITLLTFNFSSAKAECFNFDKPIKSVLSDFSFKPASGKKHIGTLEVTWATSVGDVNKPIEKVFELFLDHNTTKSPKVDEMNVSVSRDEKNWKVHLVHFVVKPFLFIKVEWKEIWSYFITQGTDSFPSQILISYEKIEGTSHIKHLCGNVVLKKISESKTQVIQYEQANATGRTVDDTFKGLEGSLKTIQDKKL